MGRGKSPGKESRKREGYFETIEGRGGGVVGSTAGLFLVLEPSCPKEFSFYPFAFFLTYIFFIFAQSRVTFAAFFWIGWFELLGALLVASHGGITVATQM